MTSTQIKKIGLLTSGGDSPGMNAAMLAVVRTCSYHNIIPVGIYSGYQGLIEVVFAEMNSRSVKDIVNKGDTILMSSRSLEFKTKVGREIAYNNLKNQEIDAFVVIGGDGSFCGALTLNKELDFPVIGVPGTIDNDIYGTSLILH